MQKYSIIIYSHFRISPGDQRKLCGSPALHKRFRILHNMYGSEDYGPCSMWLVGVGVTHFPEHGPGDVMPSAA